MKAFALASRLVRDLKEMGLATLTADGRQALLDAINGGLQRMHSVAPTKSKETAGSLYLDAPLSISLGVTAASEVVTGYSFTADQLYRTIRIAGDPIDNQITGPSTLLHRYGGSASGTVAAIIYGDGVAMPEPYESLVGDPRVTETGRDLTNYEHDCRIDLARRIGEPWFYQVEANAINQNSAAPAVIRFDSLPERAYRLQCRFALAPARIGFADMIAADTEIPLRAELVELYLLPIAREILTTSDLWRDPLTKAGAIKAGAAAFTAYATLTPTTLATPRRKVGTPHGW